MSALDRAAAEQLWRDVMDAAFKSSRAESVEILHRALDALQAKLAQAERERDEARAFGEMAAREYNTLLATGKTVLTCAFCGHEYPPGTPPTQHAALTAHVEVCEKHPLAIKLAALRALLAEVAASGVAEDLPGVDYVAVHVDRETWKEITDAVA